MRFSIKAKIIASFVLIFGAWAMSSFIVYGQIKEANDNFNQVARITLPQVTHLQQLTEEQLLARVSLGKMLLKANTPAVNPARFAELKAAVTKLNSLQKSELADLTARAKQPELLAELDTYAAIDAQNNGEIDQMIALVNAGRMPEAEALYNGPLHDSLQELLRTTTRMSDFLGKETLAGSVEADEDFDEAIRFLIALFIGMVATILVAEVPLVS